MIDSVSELINTEVEEVIKSPRLSLLLFSCYSKLYLNGAAPAMCEKKQRIYYSHLKTNGMKLAELYEKAKTRTCEPAWSGLKYVPSFGHIASDLIYDDQAVRCLKEGHLKESDFIKLPQILDIEKSRNNY